MVVFFFKQKTAYEMRISDWSSDVCSSDLTRPPDDAHIAVLLNPKKEGTFIVAVFHNEKSCTPISVNADHDEAMAVARARASKTGMTIMDYTVPDAIMDFTFSDDGSGDAA